MMPLEYSFEREIYFKPNYKWYKKLWYILTFRKYKLNEYQILDRQIKEIKG